MKKFLKKELPLCSVKKEEGGEITITLPIFKGVQTIFKITKNPEGSEGYLIEISDNGFVRGSTSYATTKEEILGRVQAEMLN